MSRCETVSFERWHLSVVVLGVTVLFVLLFVLYQVAGPKLPPACDRPANRAGEHVCREATERATSPSVPFVRVLPPGSELFAWIATSAATTTFVVVLFVPSFLWWRELRLRPKPIKFARFNLAVPIALTVFVTVLVVARSRSVRFLALSAIPTLLSWVAAVPAIASLFDVQSIASSGHFEADDRQMAGGETVRALREHLDRAVGILGLQIAAWLIWYGATYRLEYALAAFRLASHGGTYAQTPDFSIVIIVYGAVLTTLLAVGFVVASHELDGRAREIAEGLVAQRAEDDPQDTRSRRAQHYADMGIERSQTERFQHLVAIAAPLIGAVFARFVT